MKSIKFICIIFTSILLVFANTSTLHAIEPIMQERYTIEEQKIKRAQFIWTSCMEDMRKNNDLSNDEIININTYIQNLMKSTKPELPLKRFEREKRALRVNTVNKLVEYNIINSSQGDILRKKLYKYDLSNLED